MLKFAANNQTLNDSNNSSLSSFFSLSSLLNESFKDLNQSKQVSIDLPLSTIYFSIIFYSLIFVFGFFGNALVILVAYCNRAQQNSTHYCLVNLSVADLLLLVVCFPSAVIDIFSKEIWYLGPYLCKITPWLEYTVAYASILTIVSISIERSLAISSPLKVKQFFTSERLWLVVILIWIISTISSIPVMISTNYKLAFHKEVGDNVTVCFISTGERWQVIYLYSSLFIFYMLPCFSLFFLYGNIVMIIKKRAKKATGSIKLKNHIQHHQTQNKLQNGNTRYFKETSKTKNEIDKCQTKHFLEILNDEYTDDKITSDSVMAINRDNSNKSNYSKNFSEILSHQKDSIMLPQINQKQIIRLLIVMTLSIFLCLLPFRVFSLWVARADMQDIKKLGAANYHSILTICRVAFYTNSALNPIFYHIISTKFRAAFKRYFQFSFNSSLNSNQKNIKKSQHHPKDENTKDECIPFGIKK